MKTLLLFITTIIFISCNSQSSNTQKRKFDKGRLEGNVYLNDYFGFKLNVDTPWHILNMKELNQLIKERIDKFNETGGNGTELSKAIDEKTDLTGDSAKSLSKPVNIMLSLTIDTIATMPHVLISSLNLRLTPKVQNETDYLVDYTNQVKKTYANYDVEISSSKIGQEKIGDKTFYTTLITIKAQNFLAYQKRYSIRVGDELLNIMTNYDSDFYLKKCLILLNNIKWE